MKVSELIALLSNVPDESIEVMVHDPVYGVNPIHELQVRPVLGETTIVII